MVVLLITTILVSLWAIPQTWNAFRHRREGWGYIQQLRVREAIGAWGWLLLLLLSTIAWLRVALTGPLPQRPFGEMWLVSFLIGLVMMVGAVWYLRLYRRLSRMASHGLRRETDLPEPELMKGESK